MSVIKCWLRSPAVHVLLVMALGVLLRTVALEAVPAGVFHDEAWSAAKAQAIITGAAPAQVYFPENNGMDALHVYVIAAVFAVTGPLALGSRVASVLAGVLTILATYWAAREWSPAGLPRHGLALTAAFVMAAMFGAIALSRSGWHAMSMALFATLGLAALLRARRTRRARWYALSGTLLGLAQYTYPSARVVPILIGLVLAIDLWRGRQQRRSILRHYAALFAAALIVFAPLGVFFVQHPEWLIARAQQTTGSLTVGQGALNTALGFVLRGDPDDLHNLPGRPLFDPLLAAAFVAGLLVAVARHRTDYVVLLMALAALSLPAAITDLAPLTRRWVGAMPLAALLAALGVVTMWQFVAARLVARRRWLASAAGAGLLAISAAWSTADYFGAYAANPQLFWAYDRGITAVADYIAARPDARIFLTPYDRFYEVIDLTLAQARRASIQSYNGAACALLPARTTQVTDWVVVDEKDQRTLPRLARYFPAGRVVWAIESPVGSYAQALQVPAGQMPQLALGHTAAVDFGGRIKLIGFDLPNPVEAGGTLKLQLALQNVSPLDRLYKIFVHVRDASGRVLAQDDRAPCDFSLNEADWRPGDILLQDFDVTLPPAMAAGSYPVIVGLYEPESSARLPVVAADQDHTEDSVTIGLITITP